MSYPNLYPALMSFKNTPRKYVVGRATDMKAHRCQHSHTKANSVSLKCRIKNCV